MTRKMVKALQAALTLDHAGGLCWAHGAWMGERDDDMHGPIVVSNLVVAGFLEGRGLPGRGPGSRRVITEAGRQHLRDRGLA